mmetsp:Transcript_56247/g.131754  ORF Transcript_56247/g.131754 Transcript_56247/m.131754 type:complete len:552 (+) Transcript_56247:55-1710(+)
MFAACTTPCVPQGCVRSADNGYEDAFTVKERLLYPPPHGKSTPTLIQGPSGPTLPTSKSAPAFVVANGDYVDMSDIEADDAPPEELTVALHKVERLRLRNLMLWCFVGALAAVVLYLLYLLLPREKQPWARRIAKEASIPIVGLLFTWFHIWLAIQMMFLPLEFIGLWNIDRSGVGIGWQGVVPRKAKKMATLSYSSARHYLDGPRQWLGRVDPKVVVTRTRANIFRLLARTLATVATKHFPQMWDLVPTAVRKQIIDNAIEQISTSSPTLWQQITEILCDPEVGIDNDNMVVTVFVENKELLNNFFLSLGDKEFRFIEHCGASMGFMLGCIQLVAFNSLSPTGRAIFLPATGFFLGIFTNWIAILMCFKPCFPHPVRICGWHICDIQGRFLKRQADVGKLYSKMLSDHFLQFDKVIAYLRTQPKLWARLKTVFLEHNTRMMRKTVSTAVESMRTLGMLPPNAMEEMEDDMQTLIVEGLADDHEMHMIAAAYIGKVTDIERRNARAIQGMAPNEFENLLHPAFKEDEWMLILVGGVLGLFVGASQAYFLST